MELFREGERTCRGEIEVNCGSDMAAGQQQRERGSNERGYLHCRGTIIEAAVARMSVAICC
jgi:hypothetical protein